MELINEFTVDVPIDRAWEVLTDVETIAPCLPGAQLQEIEGEEFRGIVKVKVGPITAQYKGKATFVEKDEVAHRVVIKADGRDTRGQGNANAMITAEMVSAGVSSTAVRVSTDLTVTGRVAQFGRGVMADVSGKLMDQFAANLSAMVINPSAAQAPAAGSAPVSAPAAGVAPGRPSAEGPGRSSMIANGTAAQPAVRKLDLPEPEPIDLLDTAGTPVLKRALPAIGIAALLWIIFRMITGRGKG